MKNRSPVQIVIARIGQKMSYSDLATRKMFGDSGHVLTFPTFDKCLQTVHRARADVAVVPVRNTVNGLICGSDKATPVIEIAKRLNLQNIHTLAFTVAHVLASYGKLDDIHGVYSKSEPLDQCSRFLESHKMLRMPLLPGSIKITDTAAAAEYVSKHRLPFSAVICNREAAEHYGIPIVRRNIANVKKNQTEFHVYQRRDDTRDFTTYIRD